jgi:hypothetical protein
MSSVIHDVGQTVGGALGLSSAYQNDPRITNLASSLQGQLNNPNAMAQAQYNQFAQNAADNTARAIAGTPGISPQQAAYMQATAGRGSQVGAAQNAAIVGLQDTAQKQNLLSNLLSGQQQLQTQAREKQYDLFGKNAQSAAAAMS